MLIEKSARLGQEAGTELRHQFGQESILQQMDRWQKDWKILKTNNAQPGDHDNCFAAWLNAFYMR